SMATTSPRVCWRRASTESTRGTMAALPGCCGRTRRSTIFHPQRRLRRRPYTQVAQRIAHPEGVGAGEGGGGGEDLGADGSPLVFRTHPLTSVGRFPSSQIGLPQWVRDRTESVIADVATLHLVESAHKTLSGPQLLLSPIYARKRSKHQLTIPLNPVNSHMSDMDANVFLTAVMPGLYAQCLSSLTELRKRLGGD
ncbi:hypothetical protein HOY82DRAFT_562569, partial [Tuber indicum]